MNTKNFMLFFSKQTYTPLNEVRINKQKFLQNFKKLQELVSNKNIFPVLKSNAYGHGLVEIAKLADKLNCKYFVVDSIYEAYTLLKAGIKTKVLISGFIDPKNLRFKKLPFSYAVWDYNQITNIHKYQPNAKFHIFLDTGMNREGVRIDELQELINKIKTIPKENFEGVISHFSSADENNEKTMSQIQKFKNGIAILEENEYELKYKHISASAGIINKYAHEFNSVRAGISLYGFNISPKTEGKIQLIPCMSLVSHIVQIKNVLKNETIGYNDTFTTKENLKIAILPLGYNDGIPREASNVALVKIKNKYCQIVGKVSMNIMAVDVTGLDVTVGDEVEIYSESPEDKNSIENVAQLTGRSPYELLVRINPSIRRVLNT